MLTTYGRVVLLTSVIAILLSLNDSFELPFLQTCTFENEKCHMEQVDKFFKLYGNGIEELDVPTMDPLYLGDITINGNSNDNFNLNLLMEKVDLYKFSKVKCLGVKGFTKDPTKPMRIVIKTLSPQLIIKTHCRVKGKLLIFPVSGETDLKIDIKNVTTVTRAKCTPYIKDGLTFYKVEELKPKLDIGSLFTSFANSTLLNGEEIFMRTFEDTINANWRVLRDEIEPPLNDAVGRAQINILDKLLATIPYNKYFKNSD